MRLIENQSADRDPIWDELSVSRCDFRPHWKGDLVNVFSTIRPVGNSVVDTESFAIACARGLASWILDNRADFGIEDRFQIIIGWDRNVRAGARQIVKTGGGFHEVAGIASGYAPVSMWGHWATNFFRNSDSEQAVAPNRSLPSSLNSTSPVSGSED